MYHDNIGTATWRDHLNKKKGQTGKKKKQKQEDFNFHLVSRDSVILLQEQINRHWANVWHLQLDLFFS